jgi:hypothetical protein
MNQSINQSIPFRPQYQPHPPIHPPTSNRLYQLNLTSFFVHSANTTKKLPNNSNSFINTITHFIDGSLNCNSIHFQFPFFNCLTQFLIIGSFPFYFMSKTFNYFLSSNFNYLYKNSFHINLLKHIFNNVSF